MKLKLLLILTLTFIYLSIHSQVVYVDSYNGNDLNIGTKDAPLATINKAVEIVNSNENDVCTVKIKPGIYILEHHVAIETEKVLGHNRIVIEASILPDDSTWTPDKMPVIISRSRIGEIMADDKYLKDNWITSFYINQSHVTIRGLKFQGYSYPKIYYAISRFNKNITDLLVEQCIFTGDNQSNILAVGVIAHGDSIQINRCIFYNTSGTVVYWQSSASNQTKTGNSMTNCIIYGCKSAVYTYSVDENFIFKNNIVSNCKSFWCKGDINNYTYLVDNCVVVNNEVYASNGEDIRDFKLDEKNVIKEGKILLKKINNLFQPLPVDHLHIIKGTLGYNLGAGLFKNR